jgi:two-component system response regulator MprA
MAIWDNADMSGMDNARILVVEDDEQIATAVRRALADEEHTVTVVHDGRSALEAARTKLPDLVVLDIMLPGIDGIEVCRRLRAAGDEVAIPMLTARTEVPQRVEGLDAGADDYLTNPFADDELLARVGTLLCRRDTAAREILRYGYVVMDVDGMEVDRGGVAIELTTLEFRLLEYFMRNPRLALSRSRILEAVWGLDVEATSNVVDVYVRYIRRKLEGAGSSILFAARAMS